MRIVLARPRAAFRHAARAYEERCERNLVEYSAVPQATQDASMSIGKAGVPERNCYEASVRYAK